MSMSIALTGEQSRGSKQRRLVPLLTFLLGTLLLALLLPVWPALRVARDGKTQLALPMRPGETFCIRYTHSVNRSPVIDTIEWAADALTVRTSLFQTYGAGIPIDADGVGKETVRTAEGLLLTGIDASHTMISLFTGTIADHHILYRQKEIRLKQIFGEKQRVTLSPGRASILEFWRFGYR